MVEPDNVTWYNSVVRVTCDVGYHYEGEMDVLIRCNETQQWEPNVTECTGEKNGSQTVVCEYIGYV